MKISVVSSVGRASTLLSAFDNALQSAGVYNYNIIQLSSIIPTGSKVVKIKKYKSNPDEFGHRLYVVKAEMRGNETGKYLAAGIGWYLLPNGRGLFVEHEIKGETRIAVESEIEMRIKNSMHDLCKFRKIPFDLKNVRSAVSIAEVKHQPTCALVLAVYQSEPWQ